MKQPDEVMGDDSIDRHPAAVGGSCSRPPRGAPLRTAAAAPGLALMALLFSPLSTSAQSTDDAPPRAEDQASATDPAGPGTGDEDGQGEAGVRELFGVGAAGQGRAGGPANPLSGRSQGRRDAPVPPDDDAAAQRDGQADGAPDAAAVPPAGGSPAPASASVPAAEAAPDDQADQDGGDGIFVPTEEIRADTAITFPVDI
jgi:hypothetical protein